MTTKSAGQVVSFWLWLSLAAGILGRDTAEVTTEAPWRNVAMFTMKIILGVNSIEFQHNFQQSLWYTILIQSVVIKPLLLFAEIQLN